MRLTWETAIGEAHTADREWPLMAIRDPSAWDQCGLGGGARRLTAGGATPRRWVRCRLRCRSWLSSDVHSRQWASPASSPRSCGCGVRAARRHSPAVGASSADPASGRNPAPMRVLVCGAGAVGARAARHLIAEGDAEAVLVADTDRKRRSAVVASLGSRAAAVDEIDPAAADLLVVASPATRHVEIARRAVAAGRHVVSVADSVGAVEGLLDLDAEARERGVVVAVQGAPPGPGGRGGAGQHLSAWGGVGLDGRAHAGRRRPPGSGRELSFF